MMNYIELEKKINRDFDNFISQYSEDSHEFFILEGLRTNIIMTAISIYRNKKLLSRNRRLRREIKLITNSFLSKALKLKTKKKLKKTDNVHKLRNKEVLFWPSDISHVRIHKKVYREIEQQNIKSIVFVTNSSFAKELQKIPFVSYEGQCASCDIPNNGFQYKILKKARFDSISCQIENTSIPFYDILSISFELYPRLIKTFEAFSYLVNSTSQLKFIFIGNGLTMEGRLVALLSKKHKIATGEVQHGTIYASQIKNIIVNYFFVFNNHYQKMINNSNNIAITVGSVIHQKYFEKEYRQKRHLELQEFISKAPWIIALSGAGHYISSRNHIAIIACIEKAICCFKDEYFIFKLHPKDDMKYYRHIQNYHNVYIVDKTHDLFSLELSEWIKLSKSLITGGSSSAFEAFLLDKHVLTIDILNELTDLFFIREEISYHSQSFLDLKQNISSVLERDNQYFDKKEKIRSFKKSFHSGEELPSEKIASFIKKIILKS